MTTKWKRILNRLQSNPGEEQLVERDGSQYGIKVLRQAGCVVRSEISVPRSDSGQSRDLYNIYAYYPIPSTELQALHLKEQTLRAKKLEALNDADVNKKTMEHYDRRRSAASRRLRAANARIKALNTEIGYVQSKINLYTEVNNFCEGKSNL